MQQNTQHLGDSSSMVKWDDNSVSTNVTHMQASPSKNVGQFRQPFPPSGVGQQVRLRTPAGQIVDPRMRLILHQRLQNQQLQQQIHQQSQLQQSQQNVHLQQSNQGGQQQQQQISQHQMQQQQQVVPQHQLQTQQLVSQHHIQNQQIQNQQQHLQQNIQTQMHQQQRQHVAMQPHQQAMQLQQQTLQTPQQQQAQPQHRQILQMHQQHPMPSPQRPSQPQMVQTMQDLQHPHLQQQQQNLKQVTQTMGSDASQSMAAAAPSQTPLPQQDGLSENNAKMSPIATSSAGSAVTNQNVVHPNTPTSTVVSSVNNPSGSQMVSELPESVTRELEQLEKEQRGNEQAKSTSELEIEMEHELLCKIIIKNLCVYIFN